MFLAVEQNIPHKPARKAILKKTATTIRATTNEVNNEKPTSRLNWLRLTCGYRITTYATKEVSMPDTTRSICRRLILSIVKSQIVLAQGIGRKQSQRRDRHSEWPLWSISSLHDVVFFPEICGVHNPLSLRAYISGERPRSGIPACFWRGSCSRRRHDRSPGGTGLCCIALFALLVSPKGVTCP